MRACTRSDTSLAIMETQLRHDMRGATLLRGRLKMASAQEWVGRLYTTVNTTANAVLFDGYLRKYQGVMGQKQGFEDNRLRLGAGARFRGGNGQQVRACTACLTACRAGTLLHTLCHMASRQASKHGRSGDAQRRTTRACHRVHVSNQCGDLRTLPCMICSLSVAPHDHAAPATNITPSSPSRQTMHN